MPRRKRFQAPLFSYGKKERIVLFFWKNTRPLIIACGEGVVRHTMRPDYKPLHECMGSSLLTLHYSLRAMPA